MKFLILFASIFCAQAHADQDRRVLFLKNSLNQVVAFLATETGKSYFAPDQLDIPHIQSIAEKTTIQITDLPLYDRFNQPRCAINTEGLIKVNSGPNCFQRLEQLPSENFATLFHELLNLAGYEDPMEIGGSHYTISKKLLDIDPLIIMQAQKVIFHSTCLLVTSSLPGKGFPDQLYPEINEMLSSKGYQVVEFTTVLNHANEYLLLDFLYGTYEDRSISAQIISKKTTEEKYLYHVQKSKVFVRYRATDSGSFEPVKFQGLKKSLAELVLNTPSCKIIKELKK